MNFLLDTCAVSEPTKVRPSPQVAAWFKSADDASLFVSALTLAELMFGIEKLPASKKKTTLANWLQQDVRSRMAERIVPVTEEIALRWGSLAGEMQRSGVVLPIIDSLLAATALTQDLVVVTRDTDVFLRCGAKVFNPWNEP